MLDRLTLSASGSSVEIIPALGGKIASMRIGGREWLWTSDTLPYVAPTEAVASDDAASYVLTADTGGYDECVPTVGACTLPNGLVLPDHGELWSQHADTERIDSASATTRWIGRRLPYAFERTLRIDGDGAVRMDYAIENRGDVRMPFLWSAHPLLPLAPDTRLDLPRGVRTRVWAQHGIDLGGERAEHAWPMLRTDGVEADFSEPTRVCGADGRWACKLFLDLPRDRDVRLAIEQGGARLEVSCDAHDVTHFGLWLNHRGWTPFEHGAPYLNLAFEPCIGAPDPLDAALGAWDASAWLAPHETRRWSLTWRVSA